MTPNFTVVVQILGPHLNLMTSHLFYRHADPADANEVFSISGGPNPIQAWSQTAGFFIRRSEFRKD